MSPTDGLAGRPAAELTAAIESREVSCVDVMTAHLDRIEALNPSFNAVVSLRPRETLLAEARRCDDQLRRGQRRGWLHGIPFAVKDLEDVAGLPTTTGLLSPEEAGVASADAPAVARLRAAGVVFVGKTNTSELGLGSHTFNEVFGPTRNPFDVRLSAGGSSGGAAAAVALGMLPLADGSDFFGSLRNPAGWCQVYALRPTPGLVPDDSSVGAQRRGAPHTLPHESQNGAWVPTDGGVVGPMAGTATDLAALLDTLAGCDPSDATRARFSSAARQPVHLTRVGWLGDLGGYLPMAGRLPDEVRSRLEPLRNLGAVIEDASLSGAGFEVERDLWPTWLLFRHSQVGSALLPLYRDPALRERMKPEARFEVEGLLGLTGAPAIGVAELAVCDARRTALHTRFAALFERFDLLALPTSQVYPFPVEQRWPREIAGRTMDTYHRWMEVTAPATLAGLPVLGLPLGLDGSGRPVGVQLIAPDHRESLLLAVATGWEQVVGRPVRPHVAV